MQSTNVIVQTGQLWKVAVSLAAVIVGGTGAVIAMTIVGTNPGHPLNLFSLALGGFGLAFAWMSIRCPNCGARWVWLAMRHHALGQWQPWLVGLTACPSCGHRRRRAA
jgi:hypothetical protein